MPRRIAAKITGVAGYVPPRIVTNSDLEKIVDTNDEWIRTRTGIRERHYADPGVASSHLGTEAAKKLLAAKGISPEEIELIVVATVTPDMLFPATACLIQDRLGAKNAWGFDLSAACSGFAYALTVGAQFVGCGYAQKSAGDRQRRDDFHPGFQRSRHLRAFRRWRRRGPAGAGSRRSEGILDFAHDVDGSGGCNLYMPGRRFAASAVARDRRQAHALRSSGRRSRSSNMPCGEWRAGLQMLERNGLTSKDLALVVPHQANLRIIRAMQERLGVDDSKVVVNIDRFANTTAATIPLGLMDAVEQKRIRKGDLVLLIAVGAGYTTGAVLMRWAY